MDASSRIRVLVVDDHAVVRSGLRYFLAIIHDIEVIGEASDGLSAVEQAEKLQPDIVLIDLKMPRMDGITAIKLIHERQPKVRIIALTTFHDEQLVHSALQAGAVGYQVKDIAAQDLAAAIRTAHHGRFALSSQATQVLVQMVNQPQSLGHDLSDRERQVLALLSRGMSNRNIGKVLQVSQNTVRHHVRGILTKLKAANRTEAAILAVEHKLVPTTSSSQ